LFCGVQRREHDEPVHYPVSCSPQAWASGAWFLILTSVLGIRPSAERKELNIVDPSCPSGWITFISGICALATAGLGWTLRATVIAPSAMSWM